jgi:hypothetical protein
MSGSETRRGRRRKDMGFASELNPSYGYPSHVLQHHIYYFANPPTSLTPQSPYT